ncbi:hypothetical protein EES38_13730 [Vibrio viridaestus]|uniref:Uncharacterized protein n=1 Tax=Vibrio viridaestus TaxID=2487322 RepID=A0A3N9TEW2_9VIBR|nr:hypothetical protein EES38_13730 [Vibrio viridaestus]
MVEFVQNSCEISLLKSLYSPAFPMEQGFFCIIIVMSFDDGCSKLWGKFESAREGFLDDAFI